MLHKGHSEQELRDYNLDINHPGEEDRVNESVQQSPPRVECRSTVRLLRNIPKVNYKPYF